MGNFKSVHMYKILLTNLHSGNNLSVTFKIQSVNDRLDSRYFGSQILLTSFIMGNFFKVERKRKTTSEQNCMQENLCNTDVDGKEFN